MKEKTIDILSNAGWYLNRKIDINELVIGYEKKGFEMFSSAKSFIEEYGMLDIYLPNIRTGVSEEYIDKYKLNRFTLHTTNMTSSVINGLLSRSYVKEHEDYIEEKLVIVGSLTDSHQYLMISESGRLFTEYGFYGKNAEEFWDRLISHDNITLWAQWEG